LATCFGSVGHHHHTIKALAFTAMELSRILSGWQPCQVVQINQCFIRDCLPARPLSCPPAWLTNQLMKSLKHYWILNYMRWLSAWNFTEYSTTLIFSLNHCALWWIVSGGLFFRIPPHPHTHTHTHTHTFSLEQLLDIVYSILIMLTDASYMHVLWMW